LMPNLTCELQGLYQVRGWAWLKEGTVAHITRLTGHLWRDAAGLLIATLGMALLLYACVYM
jgi:hypothetical protein